MMRWRRRRGDRAVDGDSDFVFFLGGRREIERAALLLSSVSQMRMVV